jgi:hypothetical protein
MRRVNRLRAIARSHLLPLVIGALVLRALIPVGFMPGANPGMSLTAAMCNPLTVDGPGSSEIIEIPGAAPLVHCEYCVVPVAGPLPDFVVLGMSPAASVGATAATPPTNYSRFALQRSQSPRGPPLA